MIRVPISEFLEIYLGAILLWLWTVWVGSNWIRNRRERRAQRTLIHCHICGWEYRDQSDVACPPCPNCGRPHERPQPTRI